ncbi:MAG: hypothetical protein IPN71_03795 [Fibrobacteres bacterium]|nr:hypothetical protein [Fibrobacterota bacterium]
MNNQTQEQSEGFLKVKAMIRMVHRAIVTEPKRSRMEIYEEIGQIYDLGSSLVRLRYSAWLKNGDECLVPKIKGRKKGDGKFLSDERESEVRKLITDSTPDQMKMPFALWNRQAVQELIYSRYGISLVITAVGKTRLLSRTLRTNFAATHLVARLLLLQVRASASIFTWYRRLATKARYVSNCIPRQLTSSDSRIS